MSWIEVLATRQLAAIHVANRASHAARHYLAGRLTHTRCLRGRNTIFHRYGKTGQINVDLPQALRVQVMAYRQEYALRSIHLLPVNLYGEIISIRAYRT